MKLDDVAAGVFAEHDVIRAVLAPEDQRFQFQPAASTPLDRAIRIDPSEGIAPSASARVMARQVVARVEVVAIRARKSWDCALRALGSATGDGGDTAEPKRCVNNGSKRWLPMPGYAFDATKTPNRCAGASSSTATWSPSVPS